MESKKRLKLISLRQVRLHDTSIEPNSIEKNASADFPDEVIMAPLLIDKTQMIGDLGELVNAVYSEFSDACTEHNLSWEAELELGFEFGVTFSARLRISPSK